MYHGKCPRLFYFRSYSFIVPVPQRRRDLSPAAALPRGAVRLLAEARHRLHDGRTHRHRRRIRLPARVHRRLVTAEGARVVGLDSHIGHCRSVIGSSNWIYGQIYHTAYSHLVLTGMLNHKTNHGSIYGQSLTPLQGQFWLDITLDNLSDLQCIPRKSREKLVRWRCSNAKDLLLVTYIVCQAA